MAEVAGPSTAEGASKEKEGAPQVKELGLTQIDGHPKDHRFIADVIFVHGLQGHPKSTWQSRTPTESRKRSWSERLTGLARSSKGDEAHGDNKFFWPAQILPRDFGDVRILTYGYDSKVTKGFMSPTSQNGIWKHSTSFLWALSRFRVDCNDRPIIFVAHSLGYVRLKILSRVRIYMGPRAQEARRSCIVLLH